MKRLHAGIFLAATALGSVAVSTRDADAVTRRVSATHCFTDSDNIDAVEFEIGMTTQSTSTSVEVWCPIPDDTLLLKADVVTIDIYGYDGNNNSSGGSVSAEACVTYSTVAGGGCGTPSTTGSSLTGHFNLHPEHDLWNPDNATAYGYVYVKVPPKDGTSSKSLFRGLRLRT